MEVSAQTLDSYLDISAEVVVETEPVNPPIGLPKMTSTPNKKSRQRQLCPECGKSFTKTSSLNDHRRLNHGYGLGPRYSCKYCSKSYMKKDVYLSHVNRHSGVKPYSCSQCLKSYQSKRNLDLHKCIHGSWDCVCSTCGKRFPSARSLRLHMHTHDKEPQFQCSKCRRKFKQRQGLRRHEKSRCSMTNVKSV